MTFNSVDQIKEAIATPDQFMQWLESRDENIVFIPATYNVCPLAKWLNQESFGIVIDVYSKSLSIFERYDKDDKGVNINHPKWMEKYTFAIDCLGINEVSKELALMALHLSLWGWEHYLWA